MLVKAITGPKVKYPQDLVRDYLHHVSNVHWIKAKDLLGKLNDACVDGRETERIIATPGGDTALLAEAIIAVGKFTNKHLDPVQINQVFHWRLKFLGSFYMHTDEHGLHNLIGSLKQDSRFKQFSFKAPAEIFNFIFKPEPRLQMSLLDHLLVPANTGCGHLRLMLEKPEIYGMSRKVLHGIIKSFFNTLWNGSTREKACINYRYLTGDHKEGAVVTITTSDAITEDSFIPAVRPSDGKTSLFIFHPQVSAFMHREQAIALVESGLFPEINKNNLGVYLDMASRVLSEGLRETISHLAWGLPQYTFELKQ